MQLDPKELIDLFETHICISVPVQLGDRLHLLEVESPLQYRLAELLDLHFSLQNLSVSETEREEAVRRAIDLKVEQIKSMLLEASQGISRLSTLIFGIPK